MFKKRELEKKSISYIHKYMSLNILNYTDPMHYKNIKNFFETIFNTIHYIIFQKNLILER